MRVEGLGVTCGRRRFDPSEPHEPAEGVAREPPLPKLRLEGRGEVFRLQLAHRVVERHIAIRRPEVAVIFGQLVLEDEVIPKRVPGQLREEAVILMAVASIMGEDHIGRNRMLQHLEVLLDLGTDVRKESVTKPLHDDLVSALRLQEQAGAVSRLPLPFRIRAEDHPVENGLRACRHKLEYRPAAADLDVVRMSAEAKHAEGPLHVTREVEREHQPDRSAPRRACGSGIGGAASEAARTVAGPGRCHTTHGASPRAYRSSRRCLSLNVSIDCQNPS